MTKTSSRPSLKHANIRDSKHHAVGSYGMIGGKTPRILVPVLDGGELASACASAMNEIRERTYRLELGESGLSIFYSVERNTKK